MEEKKDVNFTENEIVKYQEEFSEPKFWDKLRTFALKLGENATYYILILYYMMESPDVKLGNKALIIGALGYFILPTDLIPDMLPVFGFTDDLAALTLAYKTIQASVTEEIDAKAKAKVAEWF